MSYFDNHDGLEDDTKIGGSDNDSSDSSDSDSETEQEEGEGEEVEDLIETVEDLEADGEEDGEEDEDEDEDEEDEQSGGAPDDDLEEGEIGKEEEEAEIKAKKIKKIPAKTIYQKPEFTEDDEEDDDDDDGELYLQKFDRSINDNYIVNNHPESVLQNYDEILVMIKVVRDKDGIIIDDLHRTIPYLTKYEKARILGQRAKQINSGSKPFIKVHEDILDGYIIAELELKAKSIPFIIRRPLPNGGSEYWSIKDLEDISF